MVIESFFDGYSRKARLYPGLIAAFPALITTVSTSIHYSALSAVPIVFGVSVLFAVSTLIRSLGVRLEKHLIAEWRGMPTTHLLRYAGNQNPSMLRRRRTALEAIYGDPLPTVDQEISNPTAADHEYVSATRFLIVQVRERRTEFPRVHDENANYGFARNMLAIKLYALMIDVLFLALNVGVSVRKGLDISTAVPDAICLALGAFWIFFIRRNFVWERGLAYAQRLFETLDSSHMSPNAGAMTLPGQSINRIGGTHTGADKTKRP